MPGSQPKVLRWLLARGHEIVTQRSADNHGEQTWMTQDVKRNIS